MGTVVAPLHAGRSSRDKAALSVALIALSRRALYFAASECRTFSSLPKPARTALLFWKLGLVSLTLSPSPGPDFELDLDTQQRIELVQPLQRFHQPGSAFDDVFVEGEELLAGLGKLPCAGLRRSFCFDISSEGANALVVNLAPFRSVATHAPADCAPEDLRAAYRAHPTAPYYPNSRIGRLGPGLITSSR